MCSRLAMTNDMPGCRETSNCCIDTKVDSRCRVVTIANPILGPYNIGEEFTVQLFGFGGTTPYVWTSSNLPNGFTLSENGLLTGIAESVDPILIEIAITDANGNFCSTAVTITVANTFLDGLVAHWRLDEASGTRSDATGRGNNLSEIGSVGQTAGKINEAALFPGSVSNNYLSKSTNSDLGLSSGGPVDITIAGWVYFNSFPFESSVIKKWAPVGGGTYWLRQDGGGKLSWYVGSYVGPPLGSFSVASSDPLTLLTWHQFIAYHDNTRAKIGIEINHAMAVEADDLGPLGLEGGGAPDFHMGGGNLVLGLDGRLDSVSKWNRLLTSGEKALLAAGFDIGSLLP